MQPRNLTLYRLNAELRADLGQLDEALAEHRLRPVGPLELQTAGFVPPVGRGGDTPLTHTVGTCTWFTLGTEEKLLPAAVINEELRRKVDEISEEEGRRVGSRERKRLKEDLLTQLLPRAFVRSGRLSAYVDTQSGWLVIDTATRKKAEMLISAVREAMGSFPALPLAPEEGPHVLLTDWLANGNLPNGFSLGDECELRDPATGTGAIAVARRQDLDAEEVKEHLRNGKQVYKLGLVFDDRMSFVLGEDLVVRKFRLTDVALDDLPDSEDAASEADAHFALYSLEIKNLLVRMESLFGLQIDAPLRLHRQDAPASMREAAAAAQRLDNMCRAHGVTATLETPEGAVLGTFGEIDDALYAKAVAIVRSTGKASISIIQRELRIGYNRAARFIEQMERDRIVSVPASNGNRTVYNTPASPAKESP